MLSLGPRAYHGTRPRVAGASREVCHREVGGMRHEVCAPQQHRHGLLWRDVALVSRQAGSRPTGHGRRGCRGRAAQHRGRGSRLVLPAHATAVAGVRGQRRGRHGRAAALASHFNGCSDVCITFSLNALMCEHANRCLGERLIPCRLNASFSARRKQQIFVLGASVHCV